MFAIYLTSNNAKRAVKADFATYADAKAYAHEAFTIIFYEDDADNINCGDFFANDGNVYAVEPVKG